MNESIRSDIVVSAIIITRNRPQMMRDCLKHLRRQTYPPDEIIVVDSSSAEDTQAVLAEYPDVVRLRIPNGRNNMPDARNLGIAHASGDIIAFLDDDSMARPDWLHRLLEPYAEPGVGGVGGRVIDALEQSRFNPDDLRVGVLQPDGKMITNFFLDLDQPLDVDHVRGCNMSFRKNALKHIGGFDRRYIGSNVLEETDVCLRIKKAGWRLVFQPAAVVDHLAAPREGMTRGPAILDPRRALWGGHNQAYCCFKNLGFNSRTVRRALGSRPWFFVQQYLREPSWVGARAVMLNAVGCWWGLLESLLVKLPTLRADNSLPGSRRESVQK